MLQSQLENVKISYDQLRNTIVLSARRNFDSPRVRKMDQFCIEIFDFDIRYNFTIFHINKMK